MKTTKEIAADCGLEGGMVTLLERVLNNTFPATHPIEASLHDVIGALYRRIEALESCSDRLSGIFSCLLGRYPNITTIENGLEAAADERTTLLENCVIMQSRVAAIRAVPEAMDALCAEDVFGGDYAVMLSEDELALRAVILAAGGQLAQGDQANIPGEKEGGQ